jgi:hypothetical protein
MPPSAIDNPALDQNTDVLHDFRAQLLDRRIVLDPSNPDGRGLSNDSLRAHGLPRHGPIDQGVTLIDRQLCECVELGPLVE